MYVFVFLVVFCLMCLVKEFGVYVGVVVVYCGKVDFVLFYFVFLIFFV